MSAHRILRGCASSLLRRLPLAAEEIEHFHIGTDQNTALFAVPEYDRVVEVTIQGAQNISLADHGGMDNRIVIGI